jgi:OHCU decarboxylase
MTRSKTTAAPPPLTLADLNALPARRAEAALLACCGSRTWARDVAARRPFASSQALLGAADEVWRGLGPDDWREAFAAHPRIGERAAGWSATEQAAAATADAATVTRLAAANRAYEERFGYIFIVCAAGRSAEEMLALLEARMHNEPAAELRVAAGEQARITRLRLEKLLGAAPEAPREGSR